VETAISQFARWLASGPQAGDNGVAVAETCLTTLRRPAV
jgi:hypothetical protein